MAGGQAALEVPQALSRAGDLERFHPARYAGAQPRIVSIRPTFPVLFPVLAPERTVGGHPQCSFAGGNWAGLQNCSRPPRKRPVVQSMGGPLRPWSRITRFRSSVIVIHFRVWGQRIPATPAGNQGYQTRILRRSIPPGLQNRPRPLSPSRGEAASSKLCKTLAAKKMRNAELGINSIRISSAFRIPNSEFRKPVAWATNAITEGRAHFRIGTQWFSRSGCWNRRARRGPAVVASCAVQSSVTSSRVTEAGASTQCSSGPRRSVGVDLGTTVSGCSKVL